MNLFRWLTAVAASLLMLSPLWAGEVGRATSEYLAPFILPTAKPGNPQVERGRYLVTLGQCHDCHTPKGAGGRPQLDRLLSGHPEGLAPAPAVQDAISITPTLTSFTGPWGTSFTRNLTPDAETGIGKWTEQDFLKVLRTGIRKNGAAVLPPMPWEYLTQLTDEDLKAMFAYLRSIPPLKNRVPENLPPQRR